MLTIADISKRLNVPESTVRSWRDRYADYIPYHGSGRKKRYTDEALSVFAVIAKLSAEGATATTVAERISTEFTRYIDNRNDNSSNAAIQEFIPENRIAAALERLIQMQEDNKALTDKIDLLEKRLEALESSKKASLIDRLLRRKK
jgi:DNA-binding transcriptional MerR regulator